MADMMTTSEALGVARTLQNHYRAFERIVGLIEMVEQIDKTIPNLERRQTEAKRKTTLEEKRLADYVADVDSKIAALEETLTAARTTHKAEMNKMAKEQSEAAAAKRSEIKSLTDELTKLEQSHADYMAKMDKDRVSMEKTVSKLREELDGLKARIASA